MDSARPAAAAPAAHLRADARRNRDAILAAACELFIEVGPAAPFDEIARRAGVGIATLYRRFPDREALMRAVVLDVLERVAQEARAALAEERDAFTALTRYMHRALDVRIAAVMPALVGQISLEDEQIVRRREQSTEPIAALIEAAQHAGTLRGDVTFADIGLLLVRLSRPLPGPFPRALDDSLAHRHLDLLIDGLRATHDGAPAPPSGPVLTLDDLKAMAAAAEQRSP